MGTGWNLSHECGTGSSLQQGRGRVYRCRAVPGLRGAGHPLTSCNLPAPSPRANAPRPADVQKMSVKLGKSQSVPSVLSPFSEAILRKTPSPPWGRNGDSPPFSPSCHGCDTMGGVRSRRCAGRSHIGSGCPPSYRDLPTEQATFPVFGDKGL